MRGSSARRSESVERHGPAADGRLLDIVAGKAAESKKLGR
jgi:hypothetical protein